jgi:hypothetical protein
MNRATIMGLTLVLSAIGVGQAAAQEFPLTGRWTFYDYGARDIAPNIVAQDCQDSFDSYAPDGSFTGFYRNEEGDLAIAIAGICTQISQTELECRELINDIDGPVEYIYFDRITWVADDIVDYAVEDETGKFDREGSWTYYRCPL